jgi:hypothetical protein
MRRTSCAEIAPKSERDSRLGSKRRSIEALLAISYEPALAFWSWP